MKEEAAIEEPAAEEPAIEEEAAQEENADVQGVPEQNGNAAVSGGDEENPAGPGKSYPPVFLCPGESPSPGRRPGAPWASGQ